MKPVIDIHAVTEALKAQHAKELAELTEHYAEQLRQRGLTSAVTAETFNECHEALRATEQERDRERARADKAERECVERGKDIIDLHQRAIAAEAALTAAREKVKGLRRFLYHPDTGSMEVDSDGCLMDETEVLAALGVES